MKKNLRIVAGRSHPILAEKISQYLGVPLAKVNISQFSCGEYYARLDENVRGANVYVVQTCGADVNNDLMELFILIDSLKRASAKTITAVIPHFGYARQEKKSASREPISAKLVADLLTASGSTRLITVDLHSDAIQGFFNYPVDHMMTKILFTDYIKSLKIKNPVIVAPDTGRAKVAQKMADKLDAPLAFMYKTRPAHNIAEVSHLIGDVRGKTPILIDDMVDTAGTISKATEVLREHGSAEDIYLATTHAIFSGPAIERLKKANFKEIIVTDTIPLKNGNFLNNLKVISCASLLGEAISRINDNASISQLFD